MPRKRVSTPDAVVEETVEPTTTESPAPETTESPAPETTESPAPETTESPAVKADSFSSASEEPHKGGVSSPKEGQAAPEEVELQPATFSMQGLTMRCQVCGSEAHRDADQNLYCPNAHNHPPLATESNNS